MSLLNQIITADHRTTQWEKSQTRFIYEIRLLDRETAEDAFDKIEPFYNKLWATSTWDGLKANNQQPEYAKTSSHSNMWVDENNMGFSLCTSFDNEIQRDEIREKLRLFFKDDQIKYHPVTINESERLRLDRLEKSTHSVEMDVSNALLVPQVITDFMNVALTMPTNQPATYGDDILKDGMRRLKAYFEDADAAQEFARRCEHKIMKPLLSFTTKPDQESLPPVAKPLVRKFKQPRLLVAA